MDLSSIIRDISGVFYSVRDIRQFIRVSRVFSQHIGILLRISQNIFPQLLYAEIFDLFEEEKIVENTGKSGKLQHQLRPINPRHFALTIRRHYLHSYSFRLQYQYKCKKEE